MRMGGVVCFYGVKAINTNCLRFLWLNFFKLTIIALCNERLVRLPLVLFFRGLTPADAEYNFLMKAKDLDYYGIELFQAQVLKCKCRSCDIM